MAVSNLTRLQRAKLLDPKKLSDAHKKRLEKLTRSEVSTLLRIKKKLQFKGKMHRTKGKVEAYTFI